MNLATLVLVTHWNVAASPVAFSADGKTWIGGVWPDTIVFDGERPVRKLELGAVGNGEAIVALPGGRIAAGERLFDAKGAVAFEAFSSAQRLGRFAGASDTSFRPDGKVVLVAAENHPSACLCDRGRDDPTPRRAQVLRIELSDPPNEKVLVDHPDGAQLHVAAGPRLAYSDDDVLTFVDGKAVKLAGVPDELVWSGERLVVRIGDAIAVVDPDHPTIASWPAGGQIDAIAARPGAIAIATTADRETRSTITVRDEAGKELAHVTVDGYPSSLAWSPDGTELLVANDGVSLYRFKDR